MRRDELLAVARCGILTLTMLGEVAFKSGSTPGGRLPFAPEWLDALAKRKGPDAASRIMDEIERRYAEHHSQLERPGQEPIRTFMEKVVAPLVAAYGTLVDEDGSVLAAEEDVCALLDSVSPRFHWAYFSGGCSLMPMYQGTPFSVFRRVAPYVLRVRFPTPYFNFQVLEDSDDAFSYATDRCYSLDAFAEYGMTELSAMFCEANSAERAPDRHFGVEFSHSRSLIRGDGACEFTWRRVA